MKRFKVKIYSEAIADIQNISDWYIEKQTGLGKRFQETTIRQINQLSQIPFSFVIRYSKIRYMLIKKFPYMVHFHIYETNIIVEVLAVISTDRNPEYWQASTGRITL
jgi:hypothetical protein